MESIVVAFGPEGSQDTTYVLIGYHRAVQLGIEGEEWNAVGRITWKRRKQKGGDTFPMIFRPTQKGCRRFCTTRRRGRR
jgi:hypothetical protein